MTVSVKTIKANKQYALTFAANDFVAVMDSVVAILPVNRAIKPDSDVTDADPDATIAPKTKSKAAPSDVINIGDTNINWPGMKPTTAAKVARLSDKVILFTLSGNKLSWFELNAWGATGTVERTRGNTIKLSTLHNNTFYLYIDKKRITLFN